MHAKIFYLKYKFKITGVAKNKFHGQTCSEFSILCLSLRLSLKDVFNIM